MTMKPLYQDLPFPIDSHIHYYIEDLPHFIVPWHYHPAIEIMYITRGIGTRFVGDCIEQYEEGDVCMIGRRGTAGICLFACGDRRDALQAVRVAPPDL